MSYLLIFLMNCKKTYVSAIALHLQCSWDAEIKNHSPTHSMSIKVSNYVTYELSWTAKKFSPLKVCAVCKVETQT